VRVPQDFLDGYWRDARLKQVHGLSVTPMSLTT